MGHTSRRQCSGWRLRNRTAVESGSWAFRPCWDRFIQQAVLQVLQRRWDPTFSEHSYGFRPGRSTRQAVSQAQQYLGEGYSWVVDLDLEKFFDRVNHDKLMGQVAQRISDRRMLKLIRAFLNAGVREAELGRPTLEGMPQGGPR